MPDLEEKTLLTRSVAKKCHFFPVYFDGEGRCSRLLLEVQSSKPIFLQKGLRKNRRST